MMEELRSSGVRTPSSRSDALSTASMPFIISVKLREKANIDHTQVKVHGGSVRCIQEIDDLEVMEFMTSSQCSGFMHDLSTAARV